MTVYIAAGSFLDSRAVDALVPGPERVLPAVSWFEPSVPPSAATAAA